MKKSREKTLNNQSKAKIVKNVNNTNIKIINNIPRRKVMKKNNSFFAKKMAEKIHSKRSNNIMTNSYKDLSRKKIIEKLNSNNMSQRNKIIKIDLSKI